MRRRPARVLHVINGKGIGGAESLLLTLESRFDRSLVETSFANTFFAEGSFLDELRAITSNVAVFPAARLAQVPRLIARLAGHIRRGAYDVVHTHLLHSAIAGSMAAAFVRHPLIITTRHYTEEAWVGKPRAVVAADRRALRSASHVVAVSEAVQRHVLDLGVPASRASVIYNGIDVSGFDDTERPAHDGPLRIGTVGSLTWRKGHRVLLDALERLPARSAVLTIIGEGPERANLEAHIAALGLGDRVTLAGFASDVPRRLTAFDVYVQPSLEEPFGIAIIEAMASGLPVIASRTGGIPEIVHDGQNGLLVPRNDPGALAEALRRLAADAGLRRQLARAGRLTIMRDFDVSAAARRYEELYLGLVDRKGGRV